MKLRDMLKDRLKDDEEFAKKCELVKDIGIVVILSGIIIVLLFIMITFFFFYGSPWIIIWTIMLILFRIKLCDEGIVVSLIKIIQKRLDVSITILK